MFNGFSHSVKGASHKASGTVCQDSSAYLAEERYAVAVVADGHGSKKHFRSNIGSEFAVNCTIETVKRFYRNPEEFENNFPKNHKMVIRNIQKQIISAWNIKVAGHFKTNPVTPEEKSKFTADEFAKISVESYYGTTLVAAVACKGFTFGFQIGDGSLVAVFDDGETNMLIDYEESNPANITSSICNNNAASMFDSFYIENKRVLALYASTDGLYTSFGSDNDFLDYHTIITSQLKEAGMFESAVIKNLKKRSNFGTQDDISLSCIYDKDLINSRMDVIMKKIEENKQRQIAEKAKLIDG